MGWLVTRKGSDTSGNYGHKGVKGRRGGSAPGGGHGAIGIMAGASISDAQAQINEYREGLAQSKKAGLIPSKPPSESEMLEQNEAANTYLHAQATETGDWKNSTGAERGAIKHELVTQLAERAGIEYELSNTLIRQWSNTSNDSDYRSLSLQEACSEEFGTPLSEWQKGKLAGSKTYAGQPAQPLAPRDVERRFLRAMYDYTQEELGKQGLKSTDTIRMYRGVKSKYGMVGDEYLMKENAMSSWSVGKSVADQFRGYNNGTVFVTDIPVKNILCSCLTGFGCFKEGEFLALGAPGSVARVVVN